MKAYAAITGFLFLVVTFFHLMRLIEQWDITINGWHVPLALSIGGFIATGLLSFWGLFFLL